MNSLLKKILPLLSAWLFASYPVIFMWSKNWEDVFVREVALDLSLIFTATIALYFVYRAYFKNAIKASIAASITNFMFFSFGYIFNHASPTFIWLKATTKLWNYNVLIPLWVVLFFACLYHLKNTSEKMCNFLYNLQNILSFGLLLSTSSPLLIRLLPTTQPSPSITVSEQVVTTKQKPNIYYIILDEYARHDVLKKLYDLDTTPFLEALKKQGFFIAEKSCSNYSATALSIPSSLSMNFLAIPEEDRNKTYYSSWRYSPSLTITHSPLIKLLKDNGYSFINISSGFSFTLQLKAADLEMGNYYFSSFTSFILDQSLFGPFGRKFPQIGLTKKPAKIIMDQLHYLTESTQLPSPHFVFCHILCPHAPYVFDENEEEIVDYEKTFNTAGDYKTAYKNQIIGLNKKLLPILKELIIADPHAIIIIQGDHGVCCRKENLKYYCEGEGSCDEYFLKERMGILNAYYLPSDNRPIIPTDITPVNTFRIILNHYLGTSFPLLPNTCCWSIVPQIFNFTEYSVDAINALE